MMERGYGRDEDEDEGEDFSPDSENGDNAGANMDVEVKDRNMDNEAGKDVKDAPVPDGDANDNDDSTPALDRVSNADGQKIPARALFRTPSFAKRKGQASPEKDATSQADTSHQEIEAYAPPASTVFE